MLLVDQPGAAQTYFWLANTGVAAWNTYANIQKAPGEGIIVPPDAPRAHQRRGLLGRVVGVFGIGEPDYVRPSPEENKPPERLVKRPEEQEE